MRTFLLKSVWLPAPRSLHPYNQFTGGKIKSAATMRFSSWQKQQEMFFPGLWKPFSGCTAIKFRSLFLSPLLMVLPTIWSGCGAWLIKASQCALPAVKLSVFTYLFVFVSKQFPFFPLWLNSLTKHSMGDINQIFYRGINLVKIIFWFDNLSWSGLLRFGFCQI